MSEDLLRGLNQAQRAAVTAEPGPILVLAGPGSGKTNVLTRRIVYLLRVYEAPPQSIMAVTFTNKAAGAMRQRVEKLLGERLPLQIGTFHATCARLLRIESESLPHHDRDFAIRDSSDQRAVVETAIQELNIDNKKFQPRAMLAAISGAKNEMVLPDQYPISGYRDEIIQRIYARYMEIMRDDNAMDFDDLLLEMVHLLRRNPDLRDKYQRRFAHVLVDEFQDTNTVQYHLVDVLGRPQNSVFAVGDEDQSIYAFRGADYRNVRRFREDFPDAEVILLEQNYRSTQPILDLARSVIDANANRTPKALFTERDGGTLPMLHRAQHDDEEAQYVLKRIEELRREHGYAYNDIAIMYRVNAQSRAFESTFIREGLPYQIISGLGFYERREIKDVMAYLHVVQSANDRVSFARIINVPKRGIGKKSVQSFQAWLAAQQWSYEEGLAQIAQGHASPVSKRALNQMSHFYQQLQRWRKRAQPGQLLELMDGILAEIGYDAHLREISETDEQFDERQENLQELRGLLARADADGQTLSDFLNDQALMTDLDLQPEHVDRVSLMTLHAAKGLEFPVVFLPGLEEDLLPHRRAIASEKDMPPRPDPEALAEERRLFYVGLTRAKHHLTLTYATHRALYSGRGEPRSASRFLDTLDAKLYQKSPENEREEALYPNRGDLHGTPYQRETTWNRPTSRLARDWQRGTARSSRPDHQPPSNDKVRGKIIPFPGTESASQRAVPTSQYPPGMRVRHKLYGEGIVMDSEFEGDEELVRVHFEDPRHGQKTLIASFAKLEPLND